MPLVPWPWLDAVIMANDATKGIEAKTHKFSVVCRKRGRPIIALIIELDRSTVEPVVLLQEVEHILGIMVFPMSWPLEIETTFRRGR
jgi:peptide subunit release factor RF-3